MKRKKSIYHLVLKKQKVKGAELLWSQTSCDNINLLG